jgi:hypothetical protein
MTVILSPSTLLRINSVEGRISSFEFSNSFGGFVAFQHRHPQIHPDQIGLPIFPDRQGFLPIGCFLEVKAEGVEELDFETRPQDEATTTWLRPRCLA